MAGAKLVLYELHSILSPSQKQISKPYSLCLEPFLVSLRKSLVTSMQAATARNQPVGTELWLVGFQPVTDLF